RGRECCRSKQTRGWHWPSSVQGCCRHSPAAPQRRPARRTNASRLLWGDTRGGCKLHARLLWGKTMLRRGGAATLLSAPPRDAGRVETRETRESRGPRSSRESAKSRSARLQAAPRSATTRQTLPHDIRV